jgi:hypothetical protein
MINYLGIWSDVIQSIKDDKKMFLFELLKPTIAILNEDNTVVIIVYDEEKLQFLEKKEYIELIDSKLSKYLKMEIKSCFKIRSQLNNQINQNKCKIIPFKPRIR